MSMDVLARSLAVRAKWRTPIAIALRGQSNERGQVSPAETIVGVLSRTAWPQALGSLRNPNLRYPIGPAVAKYGGLQFKLYADLYDWLRRADRQRGQGCSVTLPISSGR